MQIEPFLGSYTWIKPVKSAHELPEGAEEGTVCFSYEAPSASNNYGQDQYAFFKTRNIWKRILVGLYGFMQNPYVDGDVVNLK